MTGPPGFTRRRELAGPASPRDPELLIGAATWDRDRLHFPSPTMPTYVTYIARDRDLDGTETSTERFDRMAFAERAVSLVKPANMRVAIAEGRSRVVVESGRAWGRSEGARWAMLCVPPAASRRAIAVAVATLAAPAPAPYLLDTLLAGAAGFDG